MRKPTIGYAATKRLLARPTHPTAIFASTDLMAIGALDALIDEGLRVPQDISLIGLDNIIAWHQRLLALGRQESWPGIVLWDYERLEPGLDDLVQSGLARIMTHNPQHRSHRSRMFSGATFSKRRT